MTSCLACCQPGWVVLVSDWSVEPVLASHWSRVRVGPAAAMTGCEAWPVSGELRQRHIDTCQWEARVISSEIQRHVRPRDCGHVDDSRHVRNNQQHYSRRGLQSGGQTCPGTHDIRSQRLSLLANKLLLMSPCLCLLSDDVHPALWSICFRNPGQSLCRKSDWLRLRYFIFITAQPPFLCARVEFPIRSSFIAHRLTVPDISGAINASE